eukprot:Em0007g730a
MKLFRLLEATCHQFDLQLAYTYQEESSSSSSFTKYADKDSLVMDILIRHALERRQSVEKMFALQDGPFVKGLDETLQSFKVQRQQYFGGVFVGNHIHKTLQASSLVPRPMFSQQRMYYITAT